jgi:Galactose oxidase-like, Early set domain/Bacterial Ig-like domain (group 1)/Invasin, domain 3/Bacterial Ig-like domain (group 2)
MNGGHQVTEVTMNRRRRILALALIATLGTCVEHRAPTASEAENPDIQPATLAVAAITQTLLTSGHDANNLKIYTTASIAAVPNALVTVAVLTHRSSSAAPAPTLSGGGMTAWDLVATTTFNGATALDRVTIFRAMSPAPGSGPITITLSATVSNCQWIVSQWDGVETSGANGVGAIVQTGATSADGANGLTVALASFADAGDVGFGVFGITSATPAAMEGSGFTRIDEQPSGENTTGDLFAEWAVNQNAIDATWSTTSAGALGVELKAAAGGGSGSGVSAALSTVAASPGSITADGATSTVTVTAKDASGNPISGATVVLAATGTGNTLTQPAGPTDANGEATGTLASTVAEPKTVSAKIDGTAITQTATVTVTPGPLDAGQSTVEAAPTTIAPGSGTATITVTAKDANGNPISDATVVLATTGSATLTQPPNPTDASGVATGTLSSTTEETVTVSATIGQTAITQTATVTVTVQTAAEITQTLLTSGSNATNQKVYTTATISPSPNALITVAVLMRRSSGALSPSVTGGGMSAWEPVASVDFDTPTTPTKRLVVFRALSASPGSGPITITFAGSVSNCQWIVSQWDGVDVTGANGEGAIVQIDSARSEAASDLAVTLNAFADANDVAYGIVGVAENGPTVTPAPQFTEIAEESSGERSALQAEWATNQVAVGESWGSLTKAGMLAIELKAGVGSGGGSGVSASLSTVAASPTSITADGATSTVTVTAKDASGNPISGATVVLAATGTGNTLTQPAGPTDASGVATGTLASTVAEPKTVSAKIDGTAITQTATVTVTPGPLDAGQSTVEAAPTTIAPGSGTATITVTAKDANGNPISGLTVVLATTGSATLTQPANPTGANGVATGTLGSTIEETVTVSATIGQTAITQTATVHVMSVPVDPNQSTVAASPTTISPGSGSTITVTAKDANGNAISGATVVLATTSSASLTQPTNPTDANGVTMGMVSSSIEEIVIVSASINGTAITQTASVQVIAQTASSIVQTLLTSGNNPVNQKVYTTATIAPAPNALITVAVLMRRSSGALSPSVSGGGMSAWEAVTSVDFDTQGVPTKRLTIFRALSPSPGSGPITITFPSSVSNCQWIVSQWDGVETSGTNGSGAIVQADMGGSDGTTSLSVSLNPFNVVNDVAVDVAYGVVGVAEDGPIVTPASGFSAIAEVSSGERSALQAEWALNQPTVGASWTSSTKAGILAVEIKAGNVGPQEPVATVEVSPQSPIVVAGTTLQLTAYTLDVGGEPLAGRAITWASDAPQYATVSSSGLVTGVAVGSATISATSEGVVGTSSVTVTATAAPVASVEVTPGSANIVVGGTLQLTATPKDAAGQPLSGRLVTWGTDMAQVATVSTAGFVTGSGQGTATITATSEGQSGTSTITVTTSGQAALVGQWSAVFPAPIVQVHLHLLDDGKVLSFGGSSAIPQLWDPATGIFMARPSPALMFCSGHTFLPDGRLLVSGGGTGNGLGHPNSDIFDPATASWTAGPDMAYARWYPTNTTLPNGEVVTIAGADENGDPAPIPEIGDGTSWRQLTGASLTLPNYPRDFVAPDGRIFAAGPSKQSQWLDVTGAGSWTAGPTMNFGSRSYGSAVMYEAGKIMFVGGNSSPTNTAEIIDLNQPNPQWTYTGSLNYARWNLNATALPDGQVLVTGGVSGNRSDPSLAVNATELWNPATGTWTLMASSAALLRGYHSTALLLPDGRVIHSGGGDGGGTIDNKNFEIYSPPYLFKGARPSVAGVTGTVGYGQALTVQTPDAASITKVTLIHTGSVTHAFDEAQRLVSLTFSQGSGSLSVTLPSSPNIAPPGPYMLFLVNGNGVPSVGRIVLLQ